MNIGREYSVLLSGRFNPGRKTPGKHWIGGCVGSRSNLDLVAKRVVPTLPGIEHRSCSP